MALKSRKQEMFVKEYLIDLNATQAAIRAGYSKRTAEIIGFENLRKPNIAAEIQKAMAERGERVELTADQVLVDINTIKKSALAAGERGWQAALRACELEGKHLKMFTDKIDMNADVRVNLESWLDEINE